MVLRIQKIQGQWFRENDSETHEKLKKILKRVIKFINKNTIEIKDKKNPVLIGRHSPLSREKGNSIVFDHDHISANHAALQYQKREWKWLDFSTNGSYIQRQNNSRITLFKGGSMVPLQEGDVITLGSEVIKAPIVQIEIIEV
ncbi:FHA domain-containing protein [Candidatus Woesearchaeota archaeon]|nr:FHA domain-containing protein [Candidatus Woesearchaeota archaeon]